MARIRYIPNRVIDTNGIADGATIGVYQTGTLTPVSIYSDASFSTPLANPYTVAAGAAVPEIFANYTPSELRVRVVSSGGSVVSDDDPFDPSANAADLASADGAALIGAGSRTQADKNSDVVSVKDEGAVGGSSSLDTAGWSDTLAKAGSLLAPRSTSAYLSATPQVLQSGTHLEMASLSEIKQAAGTNSYIFTNAAYLASWVDVSSNVSWTSGTYVAQITVTGGLSQIGSPGVGDAVWLDGADQPQFNGVFDVIEVVNGSNIKVRLRRLPLASPTGTLRVKKADKDIVIDARGGQFEYNATQNTDSTPGPQAHCIMLAGIRNLRIIGGTFLDTKKFAICLAAVSQFHIEGTQGWGLNSDAIKLYGPIWDGVVENIRGIPGDDLVSLQPHEPSAFLDYQIGAGGDVLNITMRGLHCADTSSPFVSIYPSSYGVIDDILIDNLTGYTTLPAVQVYDYDGGNSVGSVTMRRVNCQAQNSFRASAATGATTVRSLDIELGPRFRTTTSGDLVNITSTATVDRIRLKTDLDAGAEIGAGTLLLLDGDARFVHLDNCRYKVNAPFVVAGAGMANLKNLTLTNCDIDVANTVIRLHAATLTGNPEIRLVGGRLVCGANSLVTVKSDATVVFDGCTLSPVPYAIEVTGGSAPEVTVYATNGARILSGNWANATGDATVSPRSYDLVLNLNASWIARNTGNMVTTVAATGSGGSSDIQAGAMAFCQGTSSGSWQQLSDSARSY